MDAQLNFWCELVPISRFGARFEDKKWGRGEGKEEEETRSGKIRIETSADWLFHNARGACLFLSLAVPKGMLKTFYRAEGN